MKKTKLALDAKLLLQKEQITSLTVTEKSTIAGGNPATIKTCSNSCILTLCNTPETTNCPPTR